MTDRLWRRYLGLGALAALGYFAFPTLPAKLIFWPLIGWSSAVAIVIGIRRHRPAGAAAWWLLAAGVTTFIVGDNLFTLRANIQHADTFPSYVDLVYLAMYPLLIAGLVVLVRRRSDRRDRASVLDAAIVTAGVGLVSWIFLIVPYVRAADLTLAERLVSIAYPLGDVALLAIVLRLAMGTGRRPPAFWLLAGGTAALLVSDALYGYLNLAGVWKEHNIVDVGWTVFYLGWGAAALHPSMQALSQPTAPSGRNRGRRLVLVGATALVPPTVLFAQQLTGTVADASIIALTSVVIFALVLIRIAGLAREGADARNEARFQTLFEHASDAILVVDSTGVIRYETPSTHRVFGRDPQELHGKELREFLQRSETEQLDTMLLNAVPLTTIEWRVLQPDGQWRDLEVLVADMRADHDVNGLVLTMRDITDRKQLEAELRRRALHDSLTGLPNRALLLDRVAQALLRGERGDATTAVLFIDLDDFKVVNDGLGHTSGDALLIAVAERLRLSLRPGDTVARLGGDEFVMLVENANAGDIDRVADRLMDTFRAPFRLGSEEVTVGASVGIGLARVGDDAPEDLVRNADLAMYVAKRKGKGRCERFVPQMHEEMSRRLEIVNELRGAIERREIFVAYQPIVSVSDGRVLGAEALARWTHRRLGVVSPRDFIPVAESAGLVIPLGELVMAEACRQTQQWKEAGLVSDDFYVSVNLSARHVQAASVIDDVAAALASSGLAPSALVVEMTETALIDELNPAESNITGLKRLGARIAVDDFGTGYSSLSYLGAFPIDIVKIDKSFVDKILLSGDGEAMVRAVIDLASALGLQAIAEGVEAASQATALERLGCTMAQGFLFA
ncbi:MAG: EAL domain-containing protein, partial [Actinobacteria bacterium]|nr:EAL domain-containing protein [Actinomycetota bacterium]